MQKRWTLLTAPAAEAAHLREVLKISPVACGILAQRGIRSFEEAKDFFRPQLSHLHNPWLMKDMRKACDRLLSAMQQREKILVFGDYDVDGTTAVACMYQFLQKIYEPSLVDFYIPHRYREGYGVSKMGIDFARDNGFTLIISLDCGIKSVDLIRYAKEMGIGFIVCDHHLPDITLPPADAILNPKQTDCPYPYKELCGCGVGFKLITAMAEELQRPAADYLCYLDLVATAIAADIVPLTGENRVLAFFGLKKVNESPNKGIKALLQLSGLKPAPLQIANLVFVIAPRVNAAGRMDDARKAVQLFVEEDEKMAMEFAAMLHSDNTDRKEADGNITEEALALIEQDLVLVNRKSTVLFQPHWHKGVVGIVASRLIEKYYRPTVVLTKSGDLVAGSARSVAGFNLYEAIYACREHLLAYGGHFAAAGMTLLPDQVELFSEKFEAVIAATLPEHLAIPEIVIDAEVSFSSLTPSLYKIIQQMEPFGPEHLRPVFIARGVTDNGWSRIVKEEHIRFSLLQENTVFSGIGFNMAHQFHLLQTKQPLDIVFTLDENEWNGQTSLQLRVIDFRLSAAEQAN
ncbi:MAG TPA: single-stranded-DNA-specific exonuclease RecJ [Chitinophagaceae bacterium]|nr:single-stranded-DNA-specific exonuclease RecJ [Chitinophagaceae bacterium]